MSAVGTNPLEANLAALGRHNAAVVAAIRAASARHDLALEPTDDGVRTATMDGVRLASRRRPLEEGRRLAESVDLAENAVVVVIGFGLGYHVRALAETAGRTTVLLVFEPDVGLLRAVFEVVDHSSWLADAMVVLVTNGDDRTALGRQLEGAEGIVAQGLTILEHPPSRKRLAEVAGPFCRMMTDLVDTTRTTMVTTLARSAETIDNLLGNVESYALGAGIDELEATARDRLAVVVSAGPSLHRNIHRLAEPGVRERCVIIAVQTTLKPLLAAGVAPHFVTALDYHEISTRFYEGLDARVVQDTTLVIDPKAHPAIARAYPGPVRCCANAYLDRVLGPLARSMGTLPAGATVAHLALYLARHLGCNPIAFIGQDLGFTDGLYYAPGTAIHDVWAPELNPFNTVPMMEWQRIARHRLHLQQLEDVHGRPIYSDVQMITYLRQFERDFAQCAEAGIRIIDATEGGVRKDGAETLDLATVLATWAAPGRERLPARAPDPATVDPDRRKALIHRLASVSRDIDDLATTSDRTRALLQRMLRDQNDPERMNRHFDVLARERRRVESRMATFKLLDEMNQLGAFKRLRADRRLQLAQAMTPAARQQAQLERDLVNVEWLRDSGRSLRRMVDDARHRVQGHDATRRRTDSRSLIRGPARSARVGAVVALDRTHAEALSRPFGEHTLLHATLRRLGAARGLDEIVVLAPDGLDLDAWIDRGALPRPIVIEHVRDTPWGREHEAIRVARRWADTSWRAGIAGMSAWDEVLCPGTMAPLAARRELDAIVPCGPDWPFIDTSAASGIDAVIARHRAFPDEHRMVFTQAPPGLGACLVSTPLLAEFTVRTRLATLGGLLVYQPHAPQGDPIARDANVQIDAELRGCFVRAIADSERRTAHCRSILSEFGPDASAIDVARRLSELDHDDARPLPQHFIVELTPRRRRTGLFGRLPGGAVSRGDLTDRQLELILDAAVDAGDAVLSFAGTGDPLEHAGWEAMLRRARGAGIPIHVRTALDANPGAIEAVAELADVVSIDLHADRAETYATMMGRDDFDAALVRLQYLIDHRRHCAGSTGTSGISLPWIVPRLERRRETSGDISSFFDRWQHVLGTALIEPTPPFDVSEEWPGDTLTDAREPASANAFEARRRMLVWSDGSVPVSEIDLQSRDCAGILGTQDVASIWRELQRRRTLAASFRIFRP